MEERLLHILHRTSYREFGNHFLRSFQETHLGVTDVNDIPGRHFDNTLTLYIHSTALRAFATGTQVLNVERSTLLFSEDGNQRMR